MSAPLCKNCTHLNQASGDCQHPDAPVDLVWGNHMPASFVRIRKNSDDGPCGREGRMFQAKDGSLDSAWRLDTGENLVGNPVGVGASTVSVEIFPVGFAPNGEIVRVKVNADHAHAFCLKTFAADFGSGQPLVVGPMEFLTVLEHGAKPVEVLALEPHHGGGTDGLSHAGTPFVDGAATVAEQGGAA